MSAARISTIFRTGNNFYSKSVLFTGLSLFAAGLNYALYPIIAHILSVGHFGEFSSLVALITQIGGVMLAFNVISIYFVAKYGEHESKLYLSIIQKGLIVVFLGLTFVTIIAFPVIGSALKISSLSDLIILTGILIFGIPAAVWSGYFQGNGEIVRVGVFAVAGSGAKLILAALGAYKWGLSGALFGILVGTLIGLVLFWLLPGSKPPLAESIKIGKDDARTINRFSAIIWRSVLAVGILSFIQIIDLLSIKMLYSGTEAGQYAGVSTLSRIVFYVGFILIWVLLPEIAKATEKHRANLIRKSYAVYLGIAALSGLGAFMAGKQIIELLLGASYMIDRNIVVWAVILQSAILFVTFQSFVLLVLNKRVVGPLVVGLFALLLCPLLLNNAVLDLVRGYALCTIALSVWLGILINRRAPNE